MSVAAYVSLGSNQGDREHNLRRGTNLLGQLPHTSVVKVSSMYETDPVGVTGQRRFLNAAAELRTSLPAERLLLEFKRIEKELGRTPGPRWGPRTLDIDLLLYGNQTIETAELTVPHPRMMQRAFVLVPLGEIAGNLVLPDGRTAGRHARLRQGEVDFYAKISLRGA